MSKNQAAILGTADGRQLAVDVPRLLETRLLVTASSGWGKSWVLRRLIEQTHGHGAMQIVIDPEGEFSSLRERFDFVIAGKGGDCPAEPRSAELLARRLLELGTSAVVDLYELRAKPAGANHVAFVRHFLEGLIHAPKHLWRPVLVWVDEAHMFAPEKGEAQSRDAVRGLMTLGRKRGFCGILATQRLAKLDKDACDAGNVLVGRFTLDVDVDRAGDFLGFTKARRPEIRRLERGEFFAFGPALSEDLVRVQVGPVATTHPRAGQRAAAPPAPRSAVLKVLEQLRDLPAEAENEARTAAELRAELAAARKQLKDLEKQRDAPRPEPKASPKRVEVQVVSDAQIKRLEALVERAKDLGAKLSEGGIEIQKALGAAAIANRAATGQPSLVIGHSPAAHPATLSRSQVDALMTRDARLKPPPKSAARAPSNVHAAPLPKGERTTLIAIAQHPDGVTSEQLTVLTGYKRSSRNAYLQRLRERGATAEGGVGIVATQAGVDMLGGDYEPLPTGDALREHWLQLGKLPEGERKVLELLCAEYPKRIPREVIDDVTGYKRSSRNAYLQRLSARRLVTTGGDAVGASAELFG